MTRLISPLDPRLEVRHVGDRELAVALRLMVVLCDKHRDLLLSSELVRPLESLLGACVDEVRLRHALQRMFCSPERAPTGRLIYGRRRPEPVTGHERIAIARARREDEAAAALPRPLPVPAPSESFSETLARLL